MTLHGLSLGKDRDRKDTIEEKILELQQRKKNLAEDLVSEDEGFLKSLTGEESEYLFS